ncbi:MAG: glycosyltransferase [Limisphaerales bacterium]
MRRNRLYYRIKPFVPWSVRVGIRRLYALRKRARVQDSWPVLPGSERPPENWPGWPDGKKFAVVLTHDVEGLSGLNKCRSVMDLESELGFHSSFNFIPQGGYHVSPQFRSELTRNGFEVGVHDLYHDGKLFRNWEGFARRATVINHYLKDWGAVGFRSAFMLRNLEWLHELDVRYDCSTFDTDPFEPQPDGVNTIFPFWVPRPNCTNHASRFTHHVSRFTDPASCFTNHVSPALRAPHSALRAPHSALRTPHSALRTPHSALSPGYVELPYTLAQDSTLFLLLRERTPDIWLEKLDWVARHGGMALVNVHPDFVRFNGEPPSARTFPAGFYVQLLDYARRRYGDSFWQPLPRELAAFAARCRPRVQTKPRRICMVSYSTYAGDARVMRYAEALAGRGDHVDVLAVRDSRDTPVRQAIAGVNVVNVQARFGKNEKSKLSFLLRVMRFLFVSSAWIARQHLRHRYDLLHIHNVPDFLVFAAAYPRLTGAKVILDIHDITPEFYCSKFGVPLGSGPMTLLKRMERLSARVAHHVIISNHLWLERYAARTCASGKCSVFINNVDARLFRPRPRARNDGKLLILFPGGLQWHQGLDIAIQAFAKVRHELPHAEFHIYGEGGQKAKLVALARDLGLDGQVRLFKPVPLCQIADIMANADLGVVPKRADSFGNEAYSTKIMEFMAVGVPLVVSNTKIDRYYFDDSIVRFFDSGNADALATAMLEVLQDQKLRRRLVERGSEYAARNCWESRKPDYLHLVDGLIGENS